MDKVNRKVTRNVAMDSPGASDALIRMGARSARREHSRSRRYIVLARAARAGALGLVHAFPGETN